MPAGDDNDVGRFRNKQARRHRVEIFGNDFSCVWEAFAVRVGFTVVDDHNLESGNGCDLVQVVGDVPGAKDV